MRNSLIDIYNFITYLYYAPLNSRYIYLSLTSILLCYSKQIICKTDVLTILVKFLSN